MTAPNRTIYMCAQADTKGELDIQRAVKMPPMPGQSRSLLQFNAMGAPNDIADLADFQVRRRHFFPFREPLMPAVSLRKIGSNGDVLVPYRSSDAGFNLAAVLLI